MAGGSDLDSRRYLEPSTPITANRTTGQPWRRIPNGKSTVIDSLRRSTSTTSSAPAASFPISTSHPPWWWPFALRDGSGQMRLASIVRSKRLPDLLEESSRQANTLPSSGSALASSRPSTTKWYSTVAMSCLHGGSKGADRPASALPLGGIIAEMLVISGRPPLRSLGQRLLLVLGPGQDLQYPNGVAAHLGYLDCPRQGAGNPRVMNYRDRPLAAGLASRARVRLPNAHAALRWHALGISTSSLVGSQPRGTLTCDDSHFSQS